MADWQIASFVDNSPIGGYPQDIVPGWEPFAVVCNTAGQRVVYVRRQIDGGAGDRARVPSPSPRQRRAQRAQARL